MENLREMIGEYTAGAFLAFGFVLLTGELFLAYFTWAGNEIESLSGDLLGLSTILHIVGGALGGYLVGRRHEENPLQAGTTTSLFAYVFEFIYNLFFVGSFKNSIWVAFSFVLGGVLGAIYANYKKVRDAYKRAEKKG